MDESEIPAEYRRTALATETVKQQKFQRWAVEMKRHGWDVHQPTAKYVRALAMQSAVKRLEAARERANHA